MKWNVPAAETKPPMSRPTVPETSRSVDSERLKPSSGIVDQSIGDGSVPPVALFTFTARSAMCSVTPGTPSRSAVATVKSRPVYVVSPCLTETSVKPTPVALIPTVPGLTVLKSALKEPPTPTKSEASITTSFTAVEPPYGAVVRDWSVKWNVPAAETKPPMSTPMVPDTSRSVASESEKSSPSTVVQSIGVGSVPPVALFTFTARSATCSVRPGMPSRSAVATVSSRPV